MFEDMKNVSVLSGKKLLLADWNEYDQNASEFSADAFRRKHSKPFYGLMITNFWQESCTHNEVQKHMKVHEFNVFLEVHFINPKLQIKIWQTSKITHIL